jgi:hypothetical protein
MRNHLLAVIVVAVGVFIAVGASSASALVKPREFTLLEVEGPQAPSFGDPGNRPPRAGDRFQTVNRLYRWTGKRGIRVGRDRVLFTFMTGFGPNFSHKAIVLIQAQAYLPDGSIFLEGYASLTPDGPSTLLLPVLGGTKNYANARGFLKVLAGRRTLLEFHLTP